MIHAQRLLPGIWRTRVVIVSAMLAGCVDVSNTPVSTIGAGAPAALDTRAAEPTSEFQHVPRFDLNVEAGGSLKPGHPIQLTVEARANFATAQAEVRLSLPEVAAGEDGGWDVVVTSLNEEFRPHIRARRSFGQGDVLREKATVSIPEPGYYHVIATAVQQRVPSRMEPFVAPGVSRRAFWLWVGEDGGRLTETFDTTLFASGDRKQSGPRGSEKKPPRVRSRGSSITCSLYPANPVIQSSDDTVVLTSGCPSPIGTQPPTSATATFQITYADGSYRPVPGAYYSWRVTSSTTGATVATSSGYTAADGSIGVIDCGGPTSERRISLQIHAVNDKADVKYNGSNAIGAPWVGSCGGHNEHRLTPRMAHLFLNVVRIYDGHRTFFPYYSEKIHAGLYDDGATYYDHLSPVGELHMANLAHMIFGEDGVMFVTHEYGHSFQDRKLWRHPAADGLMRYTRNCQARHPPESGSSFGCAFGEGFADWYAVVVRKSDLPSWYRQVEDNWYYHHCINGTTSRGTSVCTVDGSIVQGAVAALLWDISDADYETHDRIARTPNEVAEGIRACEVRQGGSVIPYDGMDHFIWCMENRSPYQVRVQAANTGRDTVLTFFNSRTRDKWATAPTGTQILRNSDDFRRLWLHTLYARRPEVGLSPTLSANFYVVEPDPDPGSDCPGCEVQQ